MANASHSYRRMHGRGLVEGASPHRLVELLFERAVHEIDVASNVIRSALDSRESDAIRRRSIDRAIAIVQELQGSLKEPQKLALSSDLFALYAFVVGRLIDANRLVSENPLTEARQVIETLRSAWSEIDPSTTVPG